MRNSKATTHIFAQSEIETKCRENEHKRNEEKKKSNRKVVTVAAIAAAAAAADGASDSCTHLLHHYCVCVCVVCNPIPMHNCHLSTKTFALTTSVFQNCRFYEKRVLCVYVSVTRYHCIGHCSQTEKKLWLKHISMQAVVVVSCSTHENLMASFFFCFLFRLWTDPQTQSIEWRLLRCGYCCCYSSVCRSVDCCYWFGWLVPLANNGSWCTCSVHGDDDVLFQVAES